jgi:SNF2 family DNA or RNA helicase
VELSEPEVTQKLEPWFQDRWENRWSIDITKELTQLFDKSLARKEPLLPYHLSQEARAGISEFSVPKGFKTALLPFQPNAVQVAAHHLHKRGGVIIGDVVGLGKTITAAALAKMFEEDFFMETLIICSKNLVTLWEGYVHQLRAKVMSISAAPHELLEERRYRLLIIDESHKLRNREGQCYRAIAEYIALNDSKVILLTATPYNKTYRDLSNQLRLFIDASANLGITPERYKASIGGRVQFEARHQVKYNTIAAFEQSDCSDDWAELMRLCLVRRTRSFIKNNYALTDEAGRKYLAFENGERSYFPDRVLVKVEYGFNQKDPHDHYAALLKKAAEATIQAAGKKSNQDLLSGRSCLLISQTSQVSAIDDFELVTWPIIKQE